MTAGRPSGRDGGIQQFGALPVLAMPGAPLRIMLVTSRETRRWIIPKGWAEVGHSGAEVAAQEALEEAGAVGAVDPLPLGTFEYDKRLADGAIMACIVEVYRLNVAHLLEDWRERAQRRREWFVASEAAGLVQEPELAAMILALEAEELA